VSFPVPEDELKLVIVNCRLNIALKFGLKSNNAYESDGRSCKQK
jgi:hypothetical protein